jgi:hypothetical protein
MPGGDHVAQQITRGYLDVDKEIRYDNQLADRISLDNQASTILSIGARNIKLLRLIWNVG